MPMGQDFKGTKITKFLLRNFSLCTLCLLGVLSGQKSDRQLSRLLEINKVYR